MTTFQKLAKLKAEHNIVIREARKALAAGFTPAQALAVGEASLKPSLDTVYVRKEEALARQRASLASTVAALQEERDLLASLTEEAK